MIQIIGYREFTSPEGEKYTAQTFLKNKWRATDLKQLYDNLDSFIQQIPPEERYNIHYTVASCAETKGRILLSQNVIPFDLDGIDLEHIEQYIDITLKVLNRTRDDVTIINSGNGLHIIVGIDEPIDYEDYFQEHTKFYNALCGDIADALYNEGLIATVDTSVFSKGKTLRLPNTMNVKAGQQEKLCHIHTNNLKFLPFDIVQLSRFPMVDVHEAFTSNRHKYEAKPDTQGVLEGCEFLNWCFHNQELVSEPQWYAQLSIIGRLENAEQLVHEHSKNHPKYTQRETDRKWKQALEASGPRLCSNINDLWGGCASCDNYECGIKSPIQIKSKSYIKTQDSGFYNLALSKDGTEMKKVSPNYDDLMRFYDSQHTFKAMEEEGSIYVFIKTHWVERSKAKIHQFAEKHFNPKPTEAMRKEFRAKLQCNQVENMEWFDEQTRGKINFSNGVLDLATMELMEHDAKHGFRYVLPFPFVRGATTTRFDKFMNDITCGDADMQQLLLEFMGYSLSGHDASFGQKALILLGEGSNGKSIFLELLQYLAGPDNYTSLSMGNEISKLENRFQLDGKLFNISEETPTNAMMDNTIFKSLVSGGTVQARKLYCNAYSMKNNAKILMACNRLPNTTDTSHGMFRRLLIVPFNATFKETDADFDPLVLQKLKAEATGIYNKVLEAYLQFVARKKFTTVKSVTLRVDEYKRVTGWNPEGTVYEWWDSRVIEDSTVGKVPCSEFYAMYKIETELDGEKPVSKRQFYHYIGTKVGEDIRCRARINGKVERCYIGLRLANKGDDCEFND